MKFLVIETTWVRIVLCPIAVFSVVYLIFNLPKKGRLGSSVQPGVGLLMVMSYALTVLVVTPFLAWRYNNVGLVVLMALPWLIVLVPISAVLLLIAGASAEIVGMIYKKLKASS